MSVEVMLFEQKANCLEMGSRRINEVVIFVFEQASNKDPRTAAFRVKYAA